jgi:hypothetical protein
VTVTVVGTVINRDDADGLTVTTAEPLPTVAFSVTVAVALIPPPIELGLTFNERIWKRLSSREVVTCWAPKVPVIVTDVAVVTILWVTVKVPVVCPADTVTVAGTLASALLLERETVNPPVGAADSSVIVPVTAVLDPPTTMDALKPTPSSAGFTVTVAVLLVLP